MKISFCRPDGEDAYIKKIYAQIIGLIFLAHLSYLFIFDLLSYTVPFIYNIGSVIFYLLMFPVIRRGCYRIAVTAIHFEICTFVVLCTVMGGWDLGIHLYLIALFSLVYFCPFDHKVIPYLFSIFEIVLFIGLHVYSRCFPPVYPPPDPLAATGLYIYSVVVCFGIILDAAFMSNVSATVTKRELQRENQNLNDLASYDQLTGLLSRHVFLRALDRTQPKAVVVAMGDIDDFKNINDTFGHNCGDYVLSTVARIMRDVCSADADICRWGGEEFIFLFHGVSPGRAAAQIESLRLSIENNECAFDVHRFHITMTFGIADNPSCLSSMDLIEHVDRLLYAGKANGKNRVVTREAYQSMLHQGTAGQRGSDP